MHAYIHIVGLQACLHTYSHMDTPTTCVYLCVRALQRRVGPSTCEETRWLSESCVVCTSPRGASAGQTITLLSDWSTVTLVRAYSFDGPQLSGAGRANVPAARAHWLLANASSDPPSGYRHDNASSWVQVAFPWSPLAFPRSSLFSRQPLLWVPRSPLALRSR